MPKVLDRLRKLISMHDVIHYTTVQLIELTMFVHKGHLTKPYYQKYLEEFFGYFQYFQSQNQVFVNLQMLS